MYLYLYNIYLNILYKYIKTIYIVLIFLVLIYAYINFKYINTRYINIDINIRIYSKRHPKQPTNIKSHIMKEFAKNLRANLIKTKNRINGIRCS